jgi:hypothetical protein
MNMRKILSGEEIREQYASWVGKSAHIGNGDTDILKSVIAAEDKIEFIFESGKKLSADDFLVLNCLNTGSH